MAKMQDLAKRIFVVGHVQPPTLHRARFVPYCPERLYMFKYDEARERTISWTRVKQSSYHRLKCGRK